MRGKNDKVISSVKNHIDQHFSSCYRGLFESHLKANLLKLHVVFYFHFIQSKMLSVISPIIMEMYK